MERAFGVTHYRLENIISGFALEKLENVPTRLIPRPVEGIIWENSQEEQSAQLREHYRICPAGGTLASPLAMGTDICSVWRSCLQGTLLGQRELDTCQVLLGAMACICKLWFWFQFLSLLLGFYEDSDSWFQSCITFPNSLAPHVMSVVHFDHSLPPHPCLCMAEIQYWRPLVWIF